MDIQHIECLKYDGDEYDGWLLLTDNNDTHMVLIDNSSQCCEDWGYFSTNDNVRDFIGLTLKEVDFHQEVDEDWREKATLFVNFHFVETSKVLQLAVYNDHNGYYGHSILYLKNGEVVHDGNL